MAPSRQVVGARQELRFETRRSVGDDQDHSLGKNIIRVVKGTCEVFGAELVNNAYRLQHGSSYGVFSWFGCEVEVDDSFCNGIYISEDIPMPQVAQIHHNLQLMRSKHEIPRVAILGGSNSGKSTLARTLVGYAVRSGGEAVLVNLDVTKNDLGVPGSISASAFESTIDLLGEAGEISLSPPNPLIYFTGCDTIIGNVSRLKDQVGCLSAVVEKKLNSNQINKTSSGVIVDTFAYSSTDASYKVLLACVETLAVNIVVVIGEDRLYAQLKKDMSTKQTKIIKIGRSGGVVERDLNTRKRLASDRFRWYFEGPRLQLSPVRRIVQIGEEIQIFLIKAKTISDASIRPIGMDTTLEDSYVPRATTADQIFLNCIFAMMNCKDETDIMQSNVIGFVHVVEVDSEAGTLTLLVPCPGPLPSKYFLHGSLKWFEIQ